MERAAREKKGSVVFDRRRDTWNFLWWESGKRRSKLIGTLDEYATKEAARQAMTRSESKEEKPAREVEQQSNPLLVEKLVRQYREERMPTRTDTRRSYEVWLRNHILPNWNTKLITDMKARPVELWLRGLKLSPKSKVHIRGLIRALWDFAMWNEAIPTQENPIHHVKIRDASKRMKKPRVLSVDEFHRFAASLPEPFRTLAIVCVCFGLRISECLALRWSDIDWLGGVLRVERGIVAQRVDQTKTDESRRDLPIDESVIEVLKTWRQATQFAATDDWMFASPAQLGRLPWSYDQVWRMYQKAAGKAGLGRVGTHCLRHTYRSWLNSVGTSIAVQKELMRHADIRTTMNVYGDVATIEMREANSKVVKLAVPGKRIAVDRSPLLSN